MAYALDRSHRKRPIRILAMPGWAMYWLLVFASAFIANIVVVALWPDSEPDLYTAAVIGAATATALVVVERMRGRGQR
jgi:hypothetical protein